MNKNLAKQEAINNTRTWGQLLALVKNAPSVGPSDINKSLTKQQAATIFEDGIKDKNQDVYPVTMTPSRKSDRMVLSSDGLIIYNILREFG